MSDQHTPDTSGGGETPPIIEVGDEMAELLRGLIANPILRIQDAARLPELIDAWREAKKHL